MELGNIDGLIYCSSVASLIAAPIPLGQAGLPVIGCPGIYIMLCSLPIIHRRLKMATNTLDFSWILNSLHRFTVLVNVHLFIYSNYFSSDSYRKGLLENLL